ncbi:hypothetical protein HK096_009938, partial [Nowakowskiella sp. JEL0078]
MYPTVENISVHKQTVKKADEEKLRRLQKSHDEQGKLALSLSKRKYLSSTTLSQRKITIKDRLESVSAISSGKTPSEIAGDLGVKTDTVTRWGEKVQWQ